MAAVLRPGLLVVHANHPESLRDVLRRWWAAHPLDPLEDEWVLVQSNGVAQWLKLSLAAPVSQGGWGIAAALRTELPSRFQWRAYRAVLGEGAVPAESAFDKPRLLWRLMRLLPPLLEEPVFAPLHRFLADDADLRKRHQLAERLADLLDQYQVYRADYAGVEHRMNNFSGRPAPAPAAIRQSDTYADTFGSGLSLRFGSADRHLRIGVDGEAVDKGYVITNPRNPAFFIHALDRGKTGRLGAYAEWRDRAGPVEAELGLRADRHTARAAAPRLGPGVPAGPAGLATAFANADRRWRGTSVDAALRLWADLGAITPRLTLARKSRAPSLVERFAWLPTEASGGLADGNIHVGDPKLKIEKAWIAELGFDWQGRTAYARPVIFWRRLDDFIQSVPFDATPGLVNTPVEMVSAASGDATPLRFANVDATIHGVDIAFGTKIAGPLRLDGVDSHVRGKRRDIADNLYRISPANARLSLTWEAERWSVSVEGQAVARQRKVSATNSEAASKGYVLAAIHGHWLVRDGLRLDLGIENLFDRRHLEHLAGYNRISGSDVALGARLPGPGRSAFARLTWAM